MKRYKVIQCYTGSVGGRILRQLLEHPQFEVVGALVSGPAKDGRDIGEIAGLAPIGVAATTDFTKILETEADVVSWNGLVATIPGSPLSGTEASLCGEDPIPRLLRSGKNVYSGTGPWYLTEGPHYDLLNDAGLAGNASFCSSGNIPGLISDALPMFVSGFAGLVSRIWCRQTNHLADHPSPHELQQHVGFGLAMDEKTGSEDIINELYRWSFEQSANMVAAAMGRKFDAFKLIAKDLAPAPEDLLLGGKLLIKKGTVAGARWTFGGFIEGYQWYTLICEETGALGLGEGWRQTAQEPQWTVRVDGSQSLEATFASAGPRDTILPTLNLNAARAISILPSLCEAAPGFRSVLDLPFITAHAASIPQS